MLSPAVSYDKQFGAGCSVPQGMLSFPVRDSTVLSADRIYTELT